MAGSNPFDTVEDQARCPSEPDNVTAMKGQSTCRILSRQSSDNECRFVSQRNRHDRRIQAGLSAVLMKSQSRISIVEIDQTQIWLLLFISKFGPKGEQPFRNWRPGTAGDRMCLLVSIAAFSVRHPSILSRIRHTHTQRRASAGHPLLEERRISKEKSDIPNKQRLCLLVEIAGEKMEAVRKWLFILQLEPPLRIVRESRHS